jgi:hypothetical protein
MSQLKKTPRNKTPKNKIKNDPLYQAVENMIPKPPKKKQVGGGDNFLRDIENMLKRNCGQNSALNQYTTTSANVNTSNIKSKDNNNDNNNNNNDNNNDDYKNDNENTITQVADYYNLSNGEKGTQTITTHHPDGTKTTVICPKKNDNKVQGGRGKKYITNQRLSENPFSDSL